MASHRSEFWDWPVEPGRHHQPDDEPVLDLQVRVSRARRTSNAPASRSIGDRIANAYFSTMVMVAKLAVAVVCTGMVLGSIWLGTILIKAAMN